MIVGIIYESNNFNIDNSRNAEHVPIVPISKVIDSMDMLLHFSLILAVSFFLCIPIDVNAAIVMNISTADISLDLYGTLINNTIHAPNTPTRANAAIIDSILHEIPILLVVLCFLIIK